MKHSESNVLAFHLQCVDAHNSFKNKAKVSSLLGRAPVSLGKRFWRLKERLLFLPGLQGEGDAFLRTVWNRSATGRSVTSSITPL
jgi:hypothetical protein